MRPRRLGNPLGPYSSTGIIQLAYIYHVMTIGYKSTATWAPLGGSSRTVVLLRLSSPLAPYTPIAIFQSTSIYRVQTVRFKSTTSLGRLGGTSRTGQLCSPLGPCRVATRASGTCISRFMFHKHSSRKAYSRHTCRHKRQMYLKGDVPKTLVKKF